MVRPDSKRTTDMVWRKGRKRASTPPPHDGERVERQGSHSSSELMPEAAAAEHQEMLEGAHALPATPCGWATAKDRLEGGCPLPVLPPPPAPTALLRMTATS